MWVLSTTTRLMSLRKEKKMDSEYQTEVKVKDQLKLEISQEVVKILNCNSQSCSSCICINIWVAQKRETKVMSKSIKVLIIDTAIWVIQVQTRIYKIQLDKTTVAYLVMIAPESWWEYQMKWVLGSDNQIVEINCLDKILTAKWAIQFVDLSLEMKWEEDNNKSKFISLHSKRTWAVQARCINNSIQTTSIRLQRVHIGMESEITLRLLQSVTLATRMLSTYHQWSKVWASTAMIRETMEAVPSKMSINDYVNIKEVKEKQVCQKLFFNRTVKVDNPTTVHQKCRQKQHLLLPNN